MPKTVFLVGNDINNIVPNNSWRELLQDIIKYCKAERLVTNIENKPFPLLYEEIFLKSLKPTHHKEIDLKKYISKKVLKIHQNEIHRRIRQFSMDDIITTNYEFSLEGVVPRKNNGVIDERLYSIFRHYKIGTKRYWHIHGDCKSPASINLGFEHYGGQLQQIRNYVVTGTNYKSKAVYKWPLIRRLEIKRLYGQSWIELFFTDDIYIFGLSLDFVETDLWWLLTYRARQLFYKKNAAIKNKIFYFLPAELRSRSKEKTDLLKANGVEIIDAFSGVSKTKYYINVLDFIEENRR